jgi:hypothetical protein
MNFFKNPISGNLPQNSYLSLIKIVCLINLKCNVKEKAFDYQIIYKLFRIIILHKEQRTGIVYRFWISKFYIIILNNCIFFVKTNPTYSI